MRKRILKPIAVATAAGEFKSMQTVKERESIKRRAKFNKAGGTAMAYKCVASLDNMLKEFRQERRAVCA